jgi:hypothetical protein
MKKKLICLLFHHVFQDFAHGIEVSLDCEGGIVEHAMLIAVDVVVHMLLHTLEATRTMLIGAHLIYCVHDIGDSWSEVAIGISLEFRDLRDQYLVEICKELLIGIDLRLQCSKIYEPDTVASRSLFNRFVEAVQQLAGSLDEAFESLGQSALECTLPARR